MSFEEIKASAFMIHLPAGRQVEVRAKKNSLVLLQGCLK
jgi:hypothetical protein